MYMEQKRMCWIQQVHAWCKKCVVLRVLGDKAAYPITAMVV
jgi:hypothetical protein